MGSSQPSALRVCPLNTVVVNQPSYLPWRGYFDLIQRADTFVFYDDVQYDKHGWRNRNRIKTATGVQWITIPVLSGGAVEGAVPINRIRIDNRGNFRRKHLESIRHAYSRAPHFGETFSFLTDAFANDYEFLADFTIDLTIRISRYLGLQTHFIRSSQLQGISGSKTGRLLATLKAVGATRYISGPSARAYIEPNHFEREGVALEYIDYVYAPYTQIHGEFEPYVSVIDLLMMKGKDAPLYLKAISRDHSLQ